MRVLTWEHEHYGGASVLAYSEHGDDFLKDFAKEKSQTELEWKESQLGYWYANAKDIHYEIRDEFEVKFF